MHLGVWTQVCAQVLPSWLCLPSWAWSQDPVWVLPLELDWIGTPAGAAWGLRTTGLEWSSPRRRALTILLWAEAVPWVGEIRAAMRSRISSLRLQTQRLLFSFIHPGKQQTQRLDLSESPSLPSLQEPVSPTWGFQDKPIRSLLLIRVLKGEGT